MNLEQIRACCHVDSNGCWRWDGSLIAGHPGNIWVDGKQYSARRYVWMLKHGQPPPAGWFVSLKCCHADCANPRHMYLRTKSQITLASRKPSLESLMRSTAKQRARAPKLTMERAREIRARAGAGETYAAIAPDYGVCIAMICRVVRDKAWRESSPWAGLRR